MELEYNKLEFQLILQQPQPSHTLIHFSSNSLNSHFSQLSPTPKLSPKISLSHTLIILQIKKLFFFFNLQVNIQTFLFYFIFCQTWLIYILTFSFGRYIYIYIYTHTTFILLMSNVLFVIVIYYHYYCCFLHLLFVFYNGLLVAMCNMYKIFNR